MTDEQVQIPDEAEEKPRRRYSKRLKGPQKFEQGVTAAATTLSEAAYKGVRRWSKLSEQSALAKKDGAIEDALENWGKAMTRFGRIAAYAPQDMMEVWKPVLKPKKWLKMWRI